MAGAPPVGAPEQAYRAPGQPETAQREEPEQSQEAWRPPPPQASAQAQIQDAIPPTTVQGPAAAIPGVSVAPPEPPGSEQPPYFMDEPSQRPGSATPSIEASSSTALAREDARPETGSMAEPIIDVRGDAIEPATTSASWQPAPAASGDPYVDEPTREWTLGEGGLAAEDIAHAATARPSTPDATFARWAPEAEDDGTSERSLKELFWGED